jgi:hypothetical protein
MTKLIEKVKLRKFKREVEAFGNGHWTLDMPTKPGRYPISPRGIPVAGGHTVAYEINGKIRLTLPWTGWFWSEPLPSLPVNPDIKE